MATPAVAGKKRARIPRSDSTVLAGVWPSASVFEPKRYGTPRPPIAIRSSAVRCAYMYACAMSPSVSRPAQPMLSQTSAPRGSVAMRDEFIGNQARCRPFSPAVNPSVARTTKSASTTPRTVTARPGVISVTAVSS